MVESQYIYIGIVSGLLAVSLMVLRFKKAKKRRATVNSIHSIQDRHEIREYMIYTIPQIGTTLPSQLHQQYQPEEQQRKQDNDLPPKYDDLVLQKPTNAENSSSYPPRYNF